jgi:hypothetical protein
MKRDNDVLPVTLGRVNGQPLFVLALDRVDASGFRLKLNSYRW